MRSPSLAAATGRCLQLLSGRSDKGAQWRFAKPPLSSSFLALPPSTPEPLLVRLVRATATAAPVRRNGARGQ